MKKGKKPASVSKKIQRRTPRKAALRSDAFARAECNARSYVNYPERLLELVKKTAAKAAAAPRDVFSENWPYLQAMLRLARAYARGEYRAISEEALLAIVAALSYLIDPFDLIPDEIPFLGYVDDAAVVDFAAATAKQTLDDFMIWETTYG